MFELTGCQSSVLNVGSNPTCISTAPEGAFMVRLISFEVTKVLAWDSGSSNDVRSIEFSTTRLPVSVTSATGAAAAFCSSGVSLLDSNKTEATDVIATTASPPAITTSSFLVAIEFGRSLEFPESVS